MSDGMTWRVGPISSDTPTGWDRMTDRARKVLELALREALQLGHNYVGTEHLLLGILREGEGVGALALTKSGLSLNKARQAIITLLTTPQPVRDEQLDDLQKQVEALASKIEKLRQEKKA